MKENMEKIEEMMRISIFEVFEKMFFIFLEPSDISDNEYNIETAIRFDGAIAGEVKILFPSGVIKVMVQNMLGLKEDEFGAQDVEDCSKEAVNMVTGNFLGKLDSSKVLKLSIPTFNPGRSEISLEGNACRMDFDSDDGKVGVVLTLSDQ